MVVEREVTVLQALRGLESELAARRKGWKLDSCEDSAGVCCVQDTTGRDRGVFSLDKLRTARRRKRSDLLTSMNQSLELY